MKKRTSIVGAFLISIAVIAFVFVAAILLLWFNQSFVKSDALENLSFLDYFLDISGVELLAVFLAANIMVAIVIHYIATNIKGNFSKFNEFFYAAAYEGKMIDENQLKFKEFAEMARSVNHLLEKENVIIAELAFNEKYLQTVLDAQKDIVIVQSRGKLERANLAFYNFMKVGGLKEFKINHQCISDFFVAGENGEYLTAKCEGDTWIRYMTLYPLKMHKVKILDDGKEIIFSVNARIAEIGDDYKAVVTFHNITQLEEQKLELELEATTDALTRVANRLKFDMILEQQIEMSKRYSHNFSLILIDIDNFKKINDTFGHQVGDNILLELAMLVKNAMRKSDTFARWGGEEFAIILPQTRVKTAAKIAEKFRLKIQQHTFGDDLNITCSFGVSEYKKSYSRKELIVEVDKKLYNAKHNGKNQVSF